jgi:hypothetical protein
LESLKRFPPTATVTSALAKKVFDFDRKFYSEALTLIETLGYRQSSDYNHIKSQSRICSEIFKLTELFSCAVDQED